MRVVCLATQGERSSDAERIVRLLGPLGAELWSFDRDRKPAALRKIVARLREERPDAVVLEGTGLAGGLAVMAAARQVPYFVSTGDAVGPFIALRSRALGPAGKAYERALYRRSAGVIGWTPYLVGRALTLGAPRGMTAAGFPGADWAPAGDGTAFRDRVGIPRDAIVFGIVGSLNWTPSVGYGYGLELVRARRRVSELPVHVLVVGDGDGRARLREEAGAELDRSIWLPGRIPREEVPEALAAMDVVSLPQSVDLVGSFRYTIKLSEYVAAGRPVVTGRTPVGYDLDDGWLWRVPGDAPWDDRYVAGLSELMRTVSREDIAERQARVPVASALFDAARQAKLVSAFIMETLEDRRQPV